MANLRQIPTLFFGLQTIMVSESSAFEMGPGKLIRWSILAGWQLDVSAT